MINLILRPGILFSVQFRNTARYTISAILFTAPLAIALAVQPELLKGPALPYIAAVYALQIAAEVWRERALDTIPGYFRLRAQLTAGALVALLWRLALA